MPHRVASHRSRHDQNRLTIFTFTNLEIWRIPCRANKIALRVDMIKLHFLIFNLAADQEITIVSTLFQTIIRHIGNYFLSVLPTSSATSNMVGKLRIFGSCLSSN